MELYDAAQEWIARTRGFSVGSCYYRERRKAGQGGGWRVDFASRGTRPGRCRTGNKVPQEEPGLAAARQTRTRPCAEHPARPGSRHMDSGGLIPVQAAATLRMPPGCLRSGAFPRLTRSHSPLTTLLVPARREFGEDIRNDFVNAPIDCFGRCIFAQDPAAGSGP